MSSNFDTSFMKAALEEAQKARDLGEVPVGAVVVKDGRIIGRGHNCMIFDKNPASHAEMIALSEAAGNIGNYRLVDCALYVTLEPCPMCAYACVLARLGRIVYGTRDERTGAAGSVYDIPRDARLNHQVEITRGVLEEECSAMLTDFFKERR